MAAFERPENCKTCLHAKVCMRDQNLFGDAFIPGNPMFIDNDALFKEYQKRKAKGFPCPDFLAEIVRCRDCEYWDPGSPMATVIPTPCRCRLRRETDATTADDFCSYGRRKPDER